MAANRNFTHNSNFFFQTNLFNKDETSYAVQECNLPGLSFSHIQISKRSAFANEQGDTISYNDLNISLIIDEDLVVWKDIITSMQNMRNPVTTEGEEYMKYGYLIIQDDNTNQIIKLEFIDMIIESIDDMTFNTNSEDEIITCTVTIKYDYYVVH
jgi:hypothetical protein